MCPALLFLPVYPLWAGHARHCPGPGGCAGNWYQHTHRICAGMGYSRCRRNYRWSLSRFWFFCYGYDTGRCRTAGLPGHHSGWSRLNHRGNCRWYHYWPRTGSDSGIRKPGCQLFRCRHSPDYSLPGDDSGASYSTLWAVWFKEGGTNMSTPSKTGTTTATVPSSRLLGGKASRWIAVILIVAVIVIFFSVADDDWFAIANYTLIAAIAAIALNVLSGYTGQISLGIAFFIAIGAYPAAYLGGNIPTSSFDPLGLGLPFIIWLPAAGIVAGLVGALICPTALRLKGFYLGIVTLSLIFIGQYIFMNARGITGGPQGRSFPVPALGDATFDQQNS